MISKGQTLRNEVTGETLVFRTTAAETDGASVVVEAFVEPDGAVAAAHVHPAQEERFFVCEVSPALGFEQLLETMFSLAADGKVNRKGMPNPLRLAVIARHHFDDVRLPFPPAWLQRLGLALGAPLGRLLGFEATYTPEAPSAPTALGV
jgi:hypothetical protein